MSKATPKQSEFIKDLVGRKFATFEEFRKWIATTGIIRTNGQIFKRSINLNEMTNRITGQQASQIIDQLQTLDDVAFGKAYAPEQITEALQIVESIKQEVSQWIFSNN